MRRKEVETIGCTRMSRWLEISEADCDRKLSVARLHACPPDHQVSVGDVRRTESQLDPAGTFE
ncbi:MAG: hypothetical protein OXB95_02485 [Rhodobacteraceae bacterium]|nr:hypothetical protein [Paracoccaceae bacterium]